MPVRRFLALLLTAGCGASEEDFGEPPDDFTLDEPLPRRVCNGVV